jgi:hypothetical protein
MRMVHKIEPHTAVQGGASQGMAAITTVDCVGDCCYVVSTCEATGQRNLVGHYTDLVSAVTSCDYSGDPMCRANETVYKAKYKGVWICVVRRSVNVHDTLRSRYIGVIPLGETSVYLDYMVPAKPGEPARWRNRKDAISNAKRTLRATVCSGEDHDDGACSVS